MQYTSKVECFSLPLKTLCVTKKGSESGHDADCQQVTYNNTMKDTAHPHSSYYPREKCWKVWGGRNVHGFLAGRKGTINSCQSNTA